MDEQQNPPPSDDTPGTDSTGGTPPELSEQDARALEAFFDADRQLDRVPSQLRARAEKAAALFGLLDTAPITDRSERVARVLAKAGNASNHTDDAVLSGNDAEALDAWVLAGFDAGRVPSSLRDRARAHEAIASLVTASASRKVSQFERAQLIERTLDRVAEATESGQTLEPAFKIPGRNRWADVLSVAAVLLIAVSVLWPVMSTVRDSARQSGCATNMRGVAQAMGAYTTDNDDMLPMVTAGFGSSPWWNVGRDPSRSNSANLYTLAREQYARLAEMACPGNPNAITAPRSADARDWGNLDEISYSYRVMAKPERLNWGQPSGLVVVADRSPVVLRAVRRQVVFPLESSPNHQGQGQHALTADGSVQWMTTPVLPTGDNIWLPKPIEMAIDIAARRRGIEPIQGTEAPADRQDSFVGP
jgi:hypothetical protein